MYSLLLIDDDTKICDLLREYLEPFGFAVHAEHSGQQGMAALASAQYDLVLLDMMLPDTDGLSVLRGIRASTQIPVVMLSAQAEEVNRILGLEMGADDYVPKAFSPRELLARLRAVLRRTPSSPPSVPVTASGAQAPPCAAVLRRGELVLDRASMQASLRGRDVGLTCLEFELLYILAEHPRHVFSRETLLDKLRRDVTRVDRAIDMHISSLRRKLGDDPQNPRLVLTVRGVGYRFALQAEG